MEMDMEAFRAWVAGEILKNKAAWLHAFYATLIPTELFNEAAQENYARARTYAQKQGYSIHEYKTRTGGLTEIHKDGLIVASFEPYLTPGGEKVQLGFHASVLGKQVPVASLTKDLSHK